MSDITKFSQKALRKFCRSITDQVFLSIQEDRGLMKEYLRLVEKNGLDKVNQGIGKNVKDHFKLTNKKERIKNPKSLLIQSHQVF